MSSQHSTIGAAASPTSVPTLAERQRAITEGRERRLREIDNLRRSFYANSAATGGVPPEYCHAPMKPSMLKKRLAVEEIKRYAKCASTGFRPPHERRAPIRGNNAENEADSDTSETSVDEVAGGVSQSSEVGNRDTQGSGRGQSCLEWIDLVTVPVYLPATVVAGTRVGSGGGTRVGSGDRVGSGNGR